MKPNILPSEQRYPRVGDRVLVAQKINYENGELTEGEVAQVLTRKRFHSRGHKVRLTSGFIGRVQKFLNKDENAQPTSQIEPDKIKQTEIDDDPLALR